MNSMKKYDSDQPVLMCDAVSLLVGYIGCFIQETEEKMEADMSKSTHSLQDLGFPEDDEEGGTAGDYPNPTPAQQMAASATAGYEIPARLRTLHNLVLLGITTI